ncbi:MAG: manganese efflux pump MntP family protein [Patescibacteria group bacterium]|nr:manganese efflux pump MntP family protein [Patescibacteria group bacterium]
MNIFTVFFLALGLSMDCFAVSVAGGAKEKRPEIMHALKVAFSFGTFQALMPLFGWLVGYKVKYLISNIDHWIAFILLGAIGVKMIYESFKLDEKGKKESILNNKVLILLSVATSIDALVIGISLALIGLNITVPMIIIGVTAFLISLSGFLIGKKLNSISGRKIEIIGGLILIGIGLKILIEHLS